MKIVSTIFTKILDFWRNLGIIKSIVPTTPLPSKRTSVGHFFSVPHATKELKQPKTFHDQINLLRDRGMIIECEKIAEYFLSQNNYYHLNIYFHKFMDAKDHFREGTSFSHIIGIYRNDSWLRNKILTVLEPIEIRIQTQIAHHLGIKYGADALYRKDIYRNETTYSKNIERILKQLERRASEPIIKHHKVNYGGLFPIWVVVEFLSFSMLSKFYNSLNGKDRKEIAKQSYCIDDSLLSNWLQSLCVLRNICAHYGYLYKRRYPTPLKIENSISKNILRNNELFAYFLAIKRLSEKEAWSLFISQIDNFKIASSTFRLMDYGFQVDWKSHLY